MRAHPPLCRLIYCLLALPAVLMAPPAAAQAGPSLADAVEAAWQRSPQAAALVARQGESLAGRESARSWIAGAPVLGLAQRSDRWSERRGKRETEISLSAPVWLPGQKATRAALADANATELDAQSAAARLALAGEVRAKLWEVAAAREKMAEKRDHQHHLEELADEVARRVRAGDLARSDGLLARQEVLAAQSDVAAAAGQAAQALAGFRTLTGLADIPKPEPEPIAEQAPPRRHPRLAAAARATQRAQAALALAGANRNPPPTLGVSARRERDGSGGAARSLGFAVQIPFGGASLNRPLEAGAHTQVASSAAELAQAGAAIESDIALAREQLTLVDGALQTASARAVLTREHARLIEKAFRLGERGLADLLRAHVLAHEADMAERQQRVALGLAHAQLNQALGIIP
ncbi:outer membrane protein, heavy metal efflux system [Janthinobacterium sp. CG_23.3]|uniref:TolC family protein n=1 Tax=Janthinobacterium sp. CG_23.3 TaxID=3349634 RepID=UPI0038D3C80F